MKTTATPRLLIDGNRGIYVPKQFAAMYPHLIEHCCEDDTLGILEQGPDAEHYWEAWDEVLTRVTFCEDGITYYLSQDGDLFAIPEGFDTERWA